MVVKRIDIEALLVVENEGLTSESAVEVVVEIVIITFWLLEVVEVILKVVVLILEVLELNVSESVQEIRNHNNIIITYTYYVCKINNNN